MLSWKLLRNSIDKGTFSFPNVIKNVGILRNPEYLLAINNINCVMLALKSSPLKNSIWFQRKRQILTL